MILTITLNPLLERRLIYENINPGKVNRTDIEEFEAGGKGINVSRQLNRFGLQNLALTILGGNNGKMMRKILAIQQLNFTAINSKNETRSATLAIDKSRTNVTSYFGPNQKLEPSEISEMKSRIEKSILNSSIVVLSGSSPSPEANELFSFAIELCNEHDKVSILDTYGKHLQSCIDKSPTIIHNNIEETEKSLKINLQNENEIIDYLDFLYQKGVKLSFITNGEKPGYASKFDFKFKFESPEVKVIDPTGSGDAFVAGLCYGLEKSLVFEEFLAFASAAGTANCIQWDVCNSSQNEIDYYKTQIKISPIGKKMKIIDDSPNY
jgi:1-phosphofructokinase family hexose kinase